MFPLLAVLPIHKTHRLSGRCTKVPPSRGRAFDEIVMISSLHSLLVLTLKTARSVAISVYSLHTPVSETSVVGQTDTSPLLQRIRLHFSQCRF